MAAISHYLANALITQTLRTDPVYVALYTTDPTEADAGIEVSGGAYTRQLATFDAPALGVTVNSAEIAFAVASSEWGSVLYVGIRDALSGGNLLYYGTITVDNPILTNDRVKIPAGELFVEL